MSRANPADECADIADPLASALAKLGEARARAEANRTVAAREWKPDASALWRHHGAPRRHVDFSPPPRGEWFGAISPLLTRFCCAPAAMLAIVGPFKGNGKTQAGVEAMKRFQLAGKSSRFTTALGFFIQLRSTYSAAAKKTEDQLMQEFRKPDLLVIDEFSRRPETEWQASMIFELLNNRYMDGRKHTLLIDNLAADAFERFAGEALASRMREGGFGTFECRWAGFRE